MSIETRPDEELLSFEFAHDSAPCTILLIHGGGASGLDWDLVQPYLTSYHLLMPSLFTPHSIDLARRLATTTASTSTSTSSSSTPINWHPAYMQLLERLVKSRAKTGKAHIVGLSMGASTAIAFTSTYPDLTLSLFATGTPPLSSSSNPTSSSSSSLYQLALLGMCRLQESLPPSTVQRLLDNEVDLHGGGWDGARQRATTELVQIAMSLVRGCRPTASPSPSPSPQQQNTSTDDDRQTAQPEKKRFLILAATRGKWWMPTGDSVAVAVEVAKRLSGRGSASGSTTITTTTGDGDGDGGGRDDGTIEAKALEAPGMFHPWNRQAPDVFATCVRAAVEGPALLPTQHVRVVWSSTLA